ncbi:Oxoglutarate/iron-dependent dioxygenase [Macleaya cordata]|uniref:Oxoglutarate/iron-dependent dioxygenase n=1 Tax=Macleaya cordata TaxID=56857 RepID=A0A200QQE6_MACCD|nr:Oxoglutarate/iron-dependent dioxygenase [Macleaya cordata]
MNRPRNRGGYSRNTRGSPSNNRSHQRHHDHNHDGSSRVVPSSNDQSSPINGSHSQGQTSLDNAELARYSPNTGLVSQQCNQDHVAIPNCSNHQQDGHSMVDCSVTNDHSPRIRSPLQVQTSSENAVSYSSKVIKGSDGIEQPSNSGRHQNKQKPKEWTPKPPNQNKEPFLPSSSVNNKYQPSKIKRHQHGQTWSGISMGQEGSKHPATPPLVGSSFPHDESSLTVYAGRKDILSKSGGSQDGPNLPESERTAGCSSELLESSPTAKKFDICEIKSGGPVKLKPSLLSKNRERRQELSRTKNGPQRLQLRSGMILLKNHISHPDQLKIIKVCRDLGLCDGGFYHPGYSDGGKMHLQMMCLGKNWDPEKKLYEDRRLIDGAVPPPIPEEFKKLVKIAIQTSHTFIKEELKEKKPEEILPGMQPDICIINFYTKSGKLGLHQDKDESKESLNKRLPVVSFSIGDSADFIFADHRDEEKPEKVLLESGDVLIFGGEARHIFHGVPSIVPDSAPSFLASEANLRPGRLNLTFRQY